MIHIASSYNNLKESINIRESVYLTVILLLKSVEISFPNIVFQSCEHWTSLYFIYLFILFLLF